MLCGYNTSLVSIPYVRKLCYRFNGYFKSKRNGARKRSQTAPSLILFSTKVGNMTFDCSNCSTKNVDIGTGMSLRCVVCLFLRNSYLTIIAC